MVRTYGLTHISLAVKDVDRSVRFYRKAFGAKVTWRGEGMVQLGTPGNHDVIVLEEKKRGAGAGTSGGIRHFGFRLVDPVDIDKAVKDAVAGGGKLLSRGEHSPGFPFAYVADPDGYEVEIWFE
jgi:catechol 2,3-dioxygenase-like lactoylglutathione lyase family enzyme